MLFFFNPWKEINKKYDCGARQKENGPGYTTAFRPKSLSTDNCDFDYLDYLILFLLCHSVLIFCLCGQCMWRKVVETAHIYSCSHLGHVNRNVGEEERHGKTKRKV